MAANTRDSLRRVLLGTKERKREKITIFGTELELVQQTLGEVLSMDTSDTKNSVVDILIRTCYIPGTNERVFEESDKDEILNWPMDSWLPNVTSAVEKLNGINVEDARKK